MVNNDLVQVADESYKLLAINKRTLGTSKDSICWIQPWHLLSTLERAILWSGRGLEHWGNPQMSISALLGFHS
jgi:hypothetical protein